MVPDERRERLAQVVHRLLGAGAFEGGKRCTHVSVEGRRIVIGNAQRSVTDGKTVEQGLSDGRAGAAHAIHLAGPLDDLDQCRITGRSQNVDAQVGQAGDGDWRIPGLQITHTGRRERDQMVTHGAHPVALGAELELHQGRQPVAHPGKIGAGIVRPVERLPGHLQGGKRLVLVLVERQRLGIGRVLGPSHPDLANLETGELLRGAAEARQMIGVLVGRHDHIEPIGQRRDVVDDPVDRVGPATHRAVDPAIDHHPIGSAIVPGELEQMAIADTLAIMADGHVRCCHDSLPSYSSRACIKANGSADKAEASPPPKYRARRADAGAPPAVSRCRRRRL